MLFVQKHNFWLTSLSNISMKTEPIFYIKVNLTNRGQFPSMIMSWICFYSNSKCHILSNKTSYFLSKNPDTPGSWHQNYFFQTICAFVILQPFLAVAQAKRPYTQKNMHAKRQVNTSEQKFKERRKRRRKVDHNMFSVLMENK